MPSKVEDDWSDSDDDVGSELETSVLLGVPDGPIEAESDLADVAVSRIGGHPAFLTLNTPFESSQCKQCSRPMELLVQMWCPFEDSPLDRGLYVWGCAQGSCQRKAGSVRAWRGVRHNKEYAAKLAKKQAKQARDKAPPPGVVKPTQKGNPFSMGGTSGGANPFGLGAQIFGASTPSTVPSETSTPTPDNEENEAQASDSEDELVTAMATTTLEISVWTAAPAYPPLYLSTMSEYIPPPPKTKLPAGVRVEDQVDDEGKNGKDPSWALENYENSMDLDHVFERFVKRVSSEGEQCIRYELNGTPLPFGSDEVFNTLFPASVNTTTIVTKGDFLVQPIAARRSFTSAAVPSCPACKSKRIFECQLMPNLINVLKTTASSAQTDAERRKELEAAMGKGDATARQGMEWGTILVFSCEKDCCGSGDGQQELWAEEHVYVQWDS